jgi:hypothetical protein
MAEEVGHGSTGRSYRAQDGSYHLHGGAFYNDAEVDISAQIETVLAGPAAGLQVTGGKVQNSTAAGLQTVATGLNGIRSAWATIISTAAAALESTAGKPVQVTVGFATNSGDLDIAGWKFTSTTDPTLVAATSSATGISWMAFGS